MWGVGVGLSGVIARRAVFGLKVRDEDTQLSVPRTKTPGTTPNGSWLFEPDDSVLDLLSLVMVECSDIIPMTARITVYALTSVVSRLDTTTVPDKWQETPLKGVELEAPLGDVFAKHYVRWNYCVLGNLVIEFRHLIGLRPIGFKRLFITVAASDALVYSLVKNSNPFVGEAGCGSWEVLMLHVNLCVCVCVLFSAEYSRAAHSVHVLRPFLQSDASFTQQLLQTELFALNVLDDIKRQRNWGGVAGVQVVPHHGAGVGAGGVGVGATTGWSPEALWVFYSKTQPLLIRVCVGLAAGLLSDRVRDTAHVASGNYSSSAIVQRLAQLVVYNPDRRRGYDSGVRGEIFDGAHGGVPAVAAFMDAREYQTVETGDTCLVQLCEAVVRARVHVVSV